MIPELRTQAYICTRMHVQIHTHAHIPTKVSKEKVLSDSLL